VIDARKAIKSAIFLAVASTPIEADDRDDLSKIIELVQSQAEEIAALKTRLSELENTRLIDVAVLDAPSSSARESEPDSATAPEPSGPDLSGPVLSGPEPAFSATLYGRTQADVAVYDSRDDRSYDDGARLRRARIGVRGNLPAAFVYLIEADFASGQNAQLDDTYLRYTGIEGTDITVGQHKIFHSLDSATSDLNVSFMERNAVSTAFEVGAGGKMGVSALTYGNNWSLQYGLMLSGLGSSADERDGWSLAGRATYAPVMTHDRLLHLGISAYVRHEDDEVVRFSDELEVRNDGFRPYDSGIVAASHYSYLGGEVATTYGPLTLQGEISHMHTSADTGDHNFWGTTLQASYMLTGESKPYSGSTGAFGGLTPSQAIGEGGMGAVELALRFSHLDLRDEDTGTIGDTITIGLNWYMTDAVRLTINAVDYTAKGTGGQTVARGRAGGMRAQVRW
jgi:phosphate-selective porin OprO/OprP